MKVDQIPVAPAPHQVEAKPLDRQGRQDRVCLADVAEVRLNEQLSAALCLGQRAVRRRQRFELGRTAVLDETRLIQLHPLRPEIEQLSKNTGVHGGDGLEVGGERIKAPLPRLSEQEEADRTQEHGPGVHAERESLPELVERLGARRAEGLAGPELGNDVVVVRIEPLGHLHGWDVEGFRLSPSRHGKIDVQAHGIARPPIAGRHRPEEGDRVQNVVVQREVVRRQEVDPGFGLEPPVRRPELGRDAPELGLVHPAGPVAFRRPLQLSIRPYSWKAEVGCQRHGCLEILESKNRGPVSKSRDREGQQGV